MPLELEISLWAETPSSYGISVAFVVSEFIVGSLTFHIRVILRGPGAFRLLRAGNRGLPGLLGLGP